MRHDDSEAEYRAHLQRTNFYPAVNRIAQGIIGLITRKPAQLAASPRVQALSAVVGTSGASLDDLAEELIRETLITNWTGLLVDHPSALDFTDLSAANADLLGFRPFISVYAAESILEATHGLVRGRRALTRVRLLEDEGHRVRELLLDRDGHYEVRVHEDDGQYQFTSPPRVTTPRRDGQPLAHIPFELVSLEDKTSPRPSPLQASIDLNVQHYVASGQLAQIIWQASAGNVTVTGFGLERDEDGKPKPFQFDNSPGAVNVFNDPGVKVEWTTYDPKNAQLVLNQLAGLEDKLSTLGHSITAPEKPAPEAAETHMIRRAAENAILAGLTRSLSRKLERAINELAAWADGTTATYALNTDFLPYKLSAQEVAALIQLNQGGYLPRDIVVYALRDGGWVSQALDVDAALAAAEAELAARPPLDL